MRFRPIAEVHRPRFVAYKPTLNVRPATLVVPDLRWATESEPSRVLVELGALGYLLVSLARIGTSVALLRAAILLRRAGRRSQAGAAWVLAAFGLFVNLVFDHVSQALYFTGVGFVLAEVVQVTREPPRGQARTAHGTV